LECRPMPSLDTKRGRVNGLGSSRSLNSPGWLTVGPKRFF
jgi:hypothetical protein